MMVQRVTHIIEASIWYNGLPTLTNWTEEDTMNRRRWLPRMFGLALTGLLLVACSKPTPTPPPTSTPTPTPIPVHAAVQTVRAFHEAINAIEPSQEEEGQVMVDIGGDRFDEVVDIFRQHTTQSAGLPLSPLVLAMATGVVRFSNMEYELVSESAERAVVRATGVITIAQETGKLDEEYVVVKQDGKWLIDF